MPKKSLQQQNAHQDELDIYRIIAAFGIVLFHYTFKAHAVGNMPAINFPYLGEIFRYGYCGIYLFFVMSGYLIFCSVEKKNYRDFFISRIARLYPGFWVCVILTSLATLAWGEGRYNISMKQVLVNLTMLNGFVGVKAVDGTYWFMTHILQFYFYMFLLTIFKNRIKMQPEYIAFCWLLVSAVTYYYNIPIIRFLIMCKFSPFFISGIMFFLIRKNGLNKINTVSIILAYVLSLITAIDTCNELTKIYNVYFDKYIYAIIVSIIFILFLFASLGFIYSSQNNKKFSLCALATFPLYLLHQNIGTMWFNAYGNENNKYIMLVLVISTIVAISLSISKYIEPKIYNILKLYLFKFLQPIQTL